MSAQHPDDILAMRMMETARMERKRAAERDGIHPGGLVSAKRPGAKGYRVFSENGKTARELLAANPGLTAKELAAQSGITVRGARHIIRDAGLIKPAGRTEAGQKARDILAADPGLGYRRLSAMSGLSLTACRDIIRAARGGVLLRANPRGEGGAPRRPERLEADRLAREGKTRAEIMAATGVSRTTATRAMREAQAEAAA